MRTSTSYRNIDRAKRILRPVLAAAVWIVIWQLCSALAGDRSQLLFPSPLSVLDRIAAMVLEGDFWLSVAATVGRVLSGYAVGMAAGCALGVATHVSGALRYILDPVRTVIKSTPVTSFILLVLLWLGDSLVPAFITFLMVTPIAWSAVYEGLSGVDVELVEMARAFDVPVSRRVQGLYLPALRHQLLAASTTALGLAWKAGVTAEVLATPQFSIGSGLYDSKVYVETPDLFAWTLVVIALSLCLEKLVVRAVSNIPARKAHRWR
ncbi:MAG: ABC transporter permease subunit [Clostridia bacterium]|nr:ABC transporter permease subunit [Clostridia bacterium]